MAFVTGTASDYRDLWKKLADFVVNNPDLIIDGHQWEIKRGHINKDITYIHSKPYEDSPGILIWDVATCMGWDDSYMAYQEGNERKQGWVTRLVDFPNYIGFQNTIAVAPKTYKIKPEYWQGTTDEAARCPKDWLVEYSDDGINWLTSDVVAGEDFWLYTDEREYSITEVAAHAYWRLNITANNGDATYVAIGRLRFYDAIGTWISRGYTTEYMFKAPGWVGPATDPVYCGMRFHIDYNNYYNIEVMGAIGYDEPYGWESQPSQIQDKYNAMWEFDMEYWFVADGATLKVVFTVGERWMAFYLGKFYPFGTPAQYAYPMIVSGSRDSAIGHTSNTSIGNIQGLFDNAGAVFRPNNYWSNILGRDDLFPDTIRGGGTSIAPMLTNGRQAGNRQLPDSAYVLVPYVVEIDDNAYGELIGLKWISGDNQIPGNIVIDENSQEWLVFSNHHLIGIYDFAALELK